MRRCHLVWIRSDQPGHFSRQHISKSDTATGTPNVLHGTEQRACICSGRWAAVQLVRRTHDHGILGRSHWRGVLVVQGMECVSLLLMRPKSTDAPRAAMMMMRLDI